jgi:2-polyprenyl-3-methyl-5-hydroxy-6-metoxy-1,4-benzoquinol methylase
VEFKEADIRPKNVFDEYLRLSALDIPEYFQNVSMETVTCVACGGQKAKPALQKSGFNFDQCTECRTLFMNPRPAAEVFRRFYESAPSNSYWSNYFFPAVVEARREKIFRPRVLGIQSLLKKRGLEPKVVMDIGAGAGVFLEEWQKLSPSTELRAVEPGEALSEVCRSKGFKVLESTAEHAQEWHGQADLVVCFEVIEHVHNVNDFLASLVKLVKPGGAVVVSGLSVDGFDIQTLWEKSKSISPPHHINFLSVDGFSKSFLQFGLMDVEVLTPGQLDVDIVRNAMSDGIWNGDQWWNLVYSRGNECLRDFQEFLRKHKMSSHLWAMGFKPS